MRRALVTGGAGFIGVHLARELAQDPDLEVVLADSFARGKEDAELAELLRRPNVRMLRVDLTDAQDVGRLGSGYDEVYHLAAIIGVKNVLERPDTVVRVNALSVLNVLDWFIAGGGEKLLFSSTSEAYAWTARTRALPVPTPEDVPLALTDLDDPRASYAGSKIFGELAVRQTCRHHGKRFAIVRYHNVYGPRMGNDHVVPQLFERAMRGERPLRVYSADHRRAFCYVSDAVRATVAAMRQRAGDGRTFNVGNDAEEVTIAELARRLLAVAGIDTEILPVPAANDPVVRRCPDVALARTLLGYSPQVALDEGLTRTLAWYRKRYEEAGKA